MKTQLIKTQDKFLLVNDEEIKEGDLCLDINSNQVFKCWKNKPDGLYTWENNQSWVRSHKNCKKIISENPDFSLLSEADCKTIGWVDVEKLAKNQFSVDKYQQDWAFRRMGFVLGFKSAQSFNDKMFSLEKMRKAIDIAFTKGNNRIGFYESDYDSIIQSLQQTVWDVEVEMDCVYQGKCVKERCLIHSCDEKQPKITNNSIRVVKIL